ncbi:MAG: hypothetical protein Q8M74_01875 [Chloroflexota bacterium]|nr:hypothetical protein [Chloroflexota bacterium]
MLDFIDPDPGQALLKIVLTGVVVVLGVMLWLKLSQRVRRHGGRPMATIVTGVGIAALLVALIPELIPFDIGLIVLIAALLVIYRPDEVVKATGGPRMEWRALRQGRELQRLVARRGNPALARMNPEIRDRFKALATLEAPSTAEYLGLLRETLFTDPEAPETASRRARLAEADAALVAILGGQPMSGRGRAARESERGPTDAG